MYCRLRFGEPLITDKTTIIILIITIRRIRNISKTIMFSFMTCPSKKTVSHFILPAKWAQNAKKTSQGLTSRKP